MRDFYRYRSKARSLPTRPAPDLTKLVDSKTHFGNTNHEPKEMLRAPEGTLFAMAPGVGGVYHLATKEDRALSLTKVGSDQESDGLPTLCGKIVPIGTITGYVVEEGDECSDCLSLYSKQPFSAGT